MYGVRCAVYGVWCSAGERAINSTWRMNPIPRNDTFQTGDSFETVCEEVPGCNAQQETSETQTKQDMSCRCSGIWGPYSLQSPSVCATDKEKKQNESDWDLPYLRTFSDDS